MPSRGASIIGGCHSSIIWKRNTVAWNQEYTQRFGKNKLVHCTTFVVTYRDCYKVKVMNLQIRPNSKWNTYCTQHGSYPHRNYFVLLRFHVLCDVWPSVKTYCRHISLQVSEVIKELYPKTSVKGTSQIRSHTHFPVAHKFTNTRVSQKPPFSLGRTHFRIHQTKLQNTNKSTNAF
jgi:hypothetical protein